ncbi:TrmB family transcriptional regulator [Anaerosacchariphilus polymeriproducens]|uniref:HTH domain-containing protein n=1 Tax=Anaerosacchariphilus polymeriproducens TaxID=1812858 RepID=A0A371ASJ5_9FIRM|nr:TrmB family transcriptional regulator [Anaerosacchariphilus polymeriproducens]RDU22512.1 HTH domain-containing protein [Anaerosacchariphilus polymeriproducens]
MRIQENLEKLNFSKLETQIYLALLGTEPLSAYQLAKKIDISRTSIYNALEHMLEKGMVEMVPNDTALYIAQEPGVILGKMRFEMINAMEESEKQLKNYQELRRKNINLVFRGFETTIFKAKAILKNAKNEVYINADFDLSCFKEEFQTLKENKVRVVVFSFYDLDLECGVEFYSHYRNMNKGHLASRFMLVVDNEISLIADRGTELKEWNGTVSNNVLFTKILSEHIHNDIYLLKLRDRYGKEIYDNNLYLKTDFETRQKDEVENESNSIRLN